jgi:hypothetical protein
LLPSIELIEREAFYGDVSASFARVQEVARRWPRRAEVHLAFSGVLRAAGALEQAARECADLFCKDGSKILHLAPVGGLLSFLNRHS